MHIADRDVQLSPKEHGFQTYLWPCGVPSLHKAHLRYVHSLFPLLGFRAFAFSSHMYLHSIDSNHTLSIPHFPPKWTPRNTSQLPQYDVVTHHHKRSMWHHDWILRWELQRSLESCQGHCIPPPKLCACSLSLKILISTKDCRWDYFFLQMH